MESKLFLLPFAGLLVYTFGSFFLINIPLGVYFSPGGGVLDLGITKIMTIILLFLTIAILFFSIKRKNRDKAE